MATVDQSVVCILHCSVLCPGPWSCIWPNFLVDVRSPCEWYFFWVPKRGDTGSESFWELCQRLCVATGVGHWDKGVSPSVFTIHADLLVDVWNPLQWDLFWWPKRGDTGSVRRALLTVGLGLVTLGCQTLSPLFWNCAQSMVG